MSQPINPLDLFRSHSYHHILLVSNTTEGLRQFVQPSKNASGLVQTDFLDRVERSVFGESLSETDDSVFLIADSRRISDFSIKDVTFTVHLGAGSPSKTHAMASDLKMTMVDPSGIGLLNYLRYLVDEKLQTDYTGLFFLLHTVFVGHTDQNTTEIIDTTTITMLLHDIEVDLNTVQGTYSFSFFPVDGMGASGVEQYINLDKSFNLKSEDGSLSGFIQTFENRLNATSAEWFDRFNASIKVPGEKGTTPVDSKKYGRLVQYMITIPPRWEGEEFKMDASSANVVEKAFKAEQSKRPKDAKEATKKEKEVSAAAKKTSDESKTNKLTPQQIKEAGEKAPAQYLDTATSMNALDILNLILKSCPGVQKMASKEAQAKGDIKIFKTMTSVTSNSESLMVHFDIIEYSLPDPEKSRAAKKQEELDAKNSNAKTPKSPSKNDNPPGSIVFDYIFSGKNTDIIEFQLKLRQAMFALQNNIKMGERAKTLQNSSRKPGDTDNKDSQTDSIVYIRGKSPIIVPRRTLIQHMNDSSAPEKNQNVIQIQEDKQEFLKTLVTMHGMSNIDARLLIRGNPELFSQVTTQKIPPHVLYGENVKQYVDTAKLAKDTNKSLSAAIDVTGVKTQHRKFVEDLTRSTHEQLARDKESLEKTGKFADGPSFATSPMFVKVNVFGPSNYAFNKSSSENFSEQMYYDSWYIVLQVENRFTDGKFEQELHIKTTDLFGETTANKGDPKITEVQKAGPQYFKDISNVGNPKDGSGF